MEEDLSVLNEYHRARRVYETNTKRKEDVCWNRDGGVTKRWEVFTKKLVSEKQWKDREMVMYRDNVFGKRESPG